MKRKTLNLYEVVRIEKDAERKELSVDAVEWLMGLLALAITAWAIWG